MTTKKRMAIRQALFIGMLFIVLILVGVNYFFRPFEGYFKVKNLDNTSVQQVDETSAVDSKTLTKKDFLAQLSSKEKVAQMIAFPVTVINKDDDSKDNNKTSSVDDMIEKSIGFSQPVDSVSQNDFLRELKPGFIDIFGDEISSSSAKQAVREIKSLYKDSLLAPKFVVDHEGGSVQRLNGEGYTKLPSWKDLCEMKAIKFANLLETSARELKSTGIDIVLAPVLDVGNSKILKDRVCSDSYAVVANRSIGYTRSFNSFGIMPVLKHFPGIGNVKKDLHKDFAYTDVLEDDVKLYRYVIDESLNVGVMISHVGVSNQDSQVPCSLSNDCVNELKNAYPKILVFSDALEMNAASFDKENVDKPKDLLTISKEAILAGNEVLIYGPSVTNLDVKSIILNLSQEYDKSAKEGGNPEFKKSVDKAVEKIIDYKYVEK